MTLYPFTHFFLLLLSLIYEPRYWRAYPAMTEVRSITTSRRSLYVAVPDGVYIFDRSRLQHLRTLTAADGITEKITLCAFNSAANELLIATESRLYQFLPVTGQVLELNPPFKKVRSIGITQTGAFFDTEQGLFQKTGGGDRFRQVSAVPEPVTWFGEKETTAPQAFTFLTPYYIVDEQLHSHPLSKVWFTPFDHHLFVVADGYGVLIYNPRLGVKEGEIRIGPPPAPVNQIIPAEGGLWLITREQTVALDSIGNWHYFTTRPGELAPGRFRLLLNEVLELNRQEGITALLSLNQNDLFLGTNFGLYRLDANGKPTLRIQFHRPVNGIALVRDSLLVATDVGLLLLVNDTLVEITDPFARSDWGVFNIVQTQTTTFFGARGGILMLDSNNTWTQLIPPGFDLSQPVRTLAAGGSFLFIGTENGIIAYNLKSQTWTTIDRSTGLPSEKITALYADERFLWIASPGILTRYEYPAQLR